MNSAVKVAERAEDKLNFSLKKSLRTVLQTESSECGLACVAMIASYYGHETDLNTLRMRYSISSHGATLKQIMRIASSLKFSTRALRADLEEIRQLRTPCILHWELNHFVVLAGFRKNKVVILDPAVGERTIGLEDFGKSFTGVVLELVPTPEFKAKVDKKNLTFKHFWSRISGLKRSIAVVLSLSLLLQIFSLLSPFYMQIVVDDVLVSKDQNLLLVLAMGFGLLLSIEIFTSLVRQLVILAFSNKLSIQMSVNVFQHLLRLPLDYFQKRHIGDVVSRFGSLGAIRTFITTGVISVVLDGLMAIVTLIVMSFYSLKLTMFIIFVVAIYALLKWLFFHPIKNLSHEQLISASKESSHFMESIRAIQTIKLFEKENDRQSQWQNKIAESMNKGIKIRQWEIGFTTLNKALFGIENLLVIYFAATFVMQNIMSVGMLFAFMSYKGRFVSSMQNLISKWIEFKMLSLHFDRLSDVVFSESDKMVRDVRELPQLCARENNRDVVGNIKVKSLSFSYSESDAPIFSDISFECKTGETVAIIGPSGCGKSTLLKCLMGLNSPSSGEILIDDIPLEKVSNYRDQIAAVMQEDQLLSGSIADNIACFDSKYEMNDIENSAKQACVHKDIAKFPMGYNTLVGDMGTGLSGGQKQRIVLARALFRSPRILFMDEATSNLDVKNEKIIVKNINSLKVTRILVAHRPETIRSADRILYMNENKLIDVTRKMKR